MFHVILQTVEYLGGLPQLVVTNPYFFASLLSSFSLHLQIGLWIPLDKKGNSRRLSFFINFVNIEKDGNISI